MTRDMRIIMAAALAAISPAIALAQADDDAREIVVVLAHPDDELVVAPALAGEVRTGANVRLVFVTSGDAGPGVSDFAPGAQLAAAREEEARCAARALGIEQVTFLRFGDGTLSQRPRSADSPMRALLPVLESEILGTEPEIVVTWGPDGGYGHGDHRMVSVLVTQILQEKAPEDRPLLYYPALINTPLPPVLESQGWATTARDLASFRYYYSDTDLEAANAATQCHKTQFDEATRAALVPGFHAAVWQGSVAFREAF